jgi:hypothetical protein
MIQKAQTDVLTEVRGMAKIERGAEGVPAPAIRAVEPIAE